MLSRIKLYYDTLKRIPSRQLFFLVKEKLLKKILPIRISSLNEISNQIQKNDLKEKFKKISKLLKNVNSQQDIWNIGVEEFVSESYYSKFIKGILANYLTSNDEKILIGLWDTEHDDIEFNYNLQRMYLFAETMNTNKFTDQQKINILLSWIDQFPPSKNKAWMGFNCSIRLINWMKILSSVESWEKINETCLENIMGSIYQNIEFIEKNIEHHIPGNHVIFQYFALWLILFLLEDSLSEKYANLFEQEFGDEFLYSGLHFEKSTHYHLQVLQLGVYYCLLSSDKIDNVSTQLLEIIRKAYKIFDALCYKANHIPLIGDNCYNFFHLSLSEDSQNLNALRKFLRIDISDDELLEIKNDYLVLRYSKNHIIFDIGNIGLEQNPGHGHSDLLNIIFAYDGIPIFTDPGTKRYSSSPENMALKRASSHNTLSINGEDQSKLWGFFRWAFLPNNFEYNFLKEENKITLNGSYAGYKNIGKVDHYRKIDLYDNEVFIIDIVKYDKLKNVDQNFILSQYVKIDKSNDKLILSIGDYQFEFIIETDQNYSLQILPQKIYLSYDNPIDSNKINIKYYTRQKQFTTKVILRRLNG